MRRRCSATDSLPKGYVQDGSVSYQADIQRAIDQAARSGGDLLFPPMIYAVNEKGWQLHANMTIHMEGAVFLLSKACTAKGAVFHGHDVTDLSLCGGTILGHNAVWGDGVNIRGVHITGESGHSAARDLTMRDLSSNGIGIFGNEQHHIRDVRIHDVVVENCCNRYPDYLSKEKPEKGSMREDQGLIACYFVDDFLVAGCRLERSRFDGTHFYCCAGPVPRQQGVRGQDGRLLHRDLHRYRRPGEHPASKRLPRALTDRTRLAAERVFGKRGARKRCREGLWAH